MEYAYKYDYIQVSIILMSLDTLIAPKSLIESAFAQRGKLKCNVTLRSPTSGTVLVMRRVNWVNDMQFDNGDFKLDSKIVVNAFNKD
ncbi:hypothetical protein MTR_1g037710 [Medicago truncatula]|uniref:Uncharacterized protein n=1 Tax=Medicago truncatula TaxID=3880 RepID=A0A072VS53_MEDTR|nr:hypothetical protein MTR_1g037710 [Medicago truncatula]